MMDDPVGRTTFPKQQAPRNSELQGWGRVSNRPRKRQINTPYGRPVRSEIQGLQNIIENDENVQGSVFGKLKGYAVYAFSGIPWISKLAQSGEFPKENFNKMKDTKIEGSKQEQCLSSDDKVAATPRRSRRLNQKGNDQEVEDRQGASGMHDQDFSGELRYRGQRVEDMTVFVLKRSLRELGCEISGLKNNLQERLKSKLLELEQEKKHNASSEEAKLLFGASQSPQAPAPATATNIADFKFNLPASAQPNSPAGDTVLETAVPLVRKSDLGSSAVIKTAEEEDSEFQDALSSPVGVDMKESWQSGGEPSSSSNFKATVEEQAEEKAPTKHQSVGDMTSPSHRPLQQSSEQSPGLEQVQRSSALQLTIKPKTTSQSTGPSADEAREGQLVMAGAKEPFVQPGGLQPAAPDSQQKSPPDSSVAQDALVPSSLSLVVAPKPRHKKTPIDVVKTFLGRNSRRRRALPPHWASNTPGPYQELHGMGSAFHAPRPRPPPPPVQPLAVRLQASPDPSHSVVAKAPALEKDAMVLPFTYNSTAQEDHYSAAPISRKRDADSMQQFSRYTEDQQEEPVLSPLPSAKRHRSYIPSPSFGANTFGRTSPATFFGLGGAALLPSQSSGRRQSLAPTGMNFSLGGVGGSSNRPSSTLSRRPGLGTKNTRRHSFAGTARGSKSTSGPVGGRRRGRNVAPAVSGAIAQRILQALKETTDVPKLQKVRGTPPSAGALMPPPAAQQYSGSLPFQKSPGGLGSGVPLDRTSPQISVAMSTSPNPSPAFTSSILRADTSQQPSPLGSAFRLAAGADKTPDANKVPGMLQFGTPSGPESSVSKLEASQPGSAQKDGEAKQEEPRLVPGVPGSEFLFKEPCKAISEGEPILQGEDGPKFCFSPAGKRRRSSLTGRTPKKIRKPGVSTTPAKSDKKPEVASKEQKSEGTADKSDSKTTSSDLPPLSMAMFMDPTKWKCDVCFAYNEKTAVKCACCEAEKPGVESQPGAATAASAPPQPKFPTSVTKTAGSIGAGGFSFGGPAKPAAPAAGSIGSGGFTFGGAASNSKPDKKEATPKSGFVFGTKPKEEVAPASKPAAGLFFGSPTPSTAPNPAVAGFTFGGEANKAKGDSKKTPLEDKALSSAPFSQGFKFGGGASDKEKEGGSQQAIVATDKLPQSTGFSFGSSQSKSQESGEKREPTNKAPGFSFGSEKPASDQKATNDAPKGFTFGQTSAAPFAPKPSGFSFGTASTGQETASKPEEDHPQKTATPSNPPSAGFTFGVKTVPAGDDEGIVSKKKKRGASDQEVQPPTTFGTPAPTTAPIAGGFQFGSTNNNDAQKSENKLASFSTTPAPAPAFTFGSATTTPKPEEKKETKTPAPSFSFGAKSERPTSGATFTFGSTSKPSAPAPAPANPGPLFGAAPAPANPLPVFGATAGQAPPFGGASGSGFGFGATATNPSTPFGGGASIPAATPDSSGMDTEDNQMGTHSSNNGPAAPPAFGGFGQPAAPTAPTPGFTFGNPQPTPSAPTATPQFGFGSVTSAPTPTPGGGPAFTFGGGVPASTPSQSFSTPAPTPGGFSMGATKTKKTNRRIVKARRPKK